MKRKRNGTNENEKIKNDVKEGSAFMQKRAKEITERRDGDERKGKSREKALEQSYLDLLMPVLLRKMNFRNKEFPRIALKE